MLRNSVISTFKATSLRLHSTAPLTRSLRHRFPKLDEITAQDIGYSSQTTTPFGHGGYFLERSNKNNLPIYIQYKANDSVYTEIRKIKGDITLLRNDLQEILDDVSKKDFRILIESKKILIKGRHKERLLDVLEQVF